MFTKERNSVDAELGQMVEPPPETKEDRKITQSICSYPAINGPHPLQVNTSNLSSYMRLGPVTNICTAETIIQNEHVEGGQSSVFGNIPAFR